MSSTMSIRMDDSDKNLIMDYARTLNVSAGEFVRRAALEKIEDELDLGTWNEAKDEFDSNPVTYSFTEIKAKYL